MKQGVHPDYHYVTIKMTDGTSFVTRSTWGATGDQMTLDVDPLTHPAWTGGTGFVNERASQVAKFNNRFAGLNIGKKANS